jgi:protein-L-isoaspartate(D-aspartate) O-methyltransferase
MVADLVAAGALDQTWRAAFEWVPRHLFIPEVLWLLDRQAGGRLRPLRREDDQARWLELAYRDAPVDTQVDDGQPTAEGGWEVTSSASAPTVMAHMLRALDPQPGERVLEIGTGTGYNAGLLAYRVGPENVTSIEIDPEVADHARAALDTAGFGKVTVITGDGTDGWAEGGPYDRVIATAGVRTVPWSWVAQTRPGGRLVVPVSNTFQAPGVVTLTFQRNGTAVGRIGSPAVFMGLRAQRVPRPRGADFIGKAHSTGSTDLHPYLWAGDRAAAVAIGQRLGDGIHTMFQETGQGTGTQWLYHPGSGSWASVQLAGEPPYPVKQSGPRRLFDEVLDAYTWWVGADSPGIDAWTVTVDRHRQTIELSSPSPVTP